MKVHGISRPPWTRGDRFRRPGQSLPLSAVIVQSLPLVFILTNYLKVSLHLDWRIVKALTRCSYGTLIPSDDF